MIPTLVLAAGASSRMGQPKAMLPVPGGQTFLSRIIRTVRDAGLTEIVVVVRDAALVSQAVPAYDPPVRVVVNPEPDRGQLSSLVAGIDAVDRPEVAAVLVTLVDLPLVSVSTVRAVVERWLLTRSPVVRPVSAGRHGHPVILGRELFAPLRQGDVGAGAKPVLQTFASRFADVEVNDPGAFQDFDTPEEYARLIDPHGGHFST